MTRMLVVIFHCRFGVSALLTILNSLVGGLKEHALLGVDGWSLGG